MCSVFGPSEAEPKIAIPKREAGEDVFQWPIPRVRHLQINRARPIGKDRVPTIPRVPLMPFYVAFDLETTGLSFEFDRVVEIGAVRFDARGRVIDRFERLLNPERPISAGARAVNGLLDSDVASAPVASVVLPEFLAFLASSPEAPLIAHNAHFDASFLGRELARLGAAAPTCPAHDTLALARRKLPKLRNHRLETLASHFGIAQSVLHRAGADAMLTKELWLKLDGPNAPREILASYSIHDPVSSPRSPLGWDRLELALKAGHRVRMVYEGGTRGAGHRDITPRRFLRKGGVDYIRALCHVDSIEKSFRLDRIREFEALDPREARGAY